MKLQITGRGLVSSVDTYRGVVYALSEHSNVYKIPIGIYQVMCDLAQSTKDPKVVRKYLEEFVSDRFPGKVLNSFIDLSSKDIAQLNKKGVTGLEWGMYIQVVDPQEPGELLLPGIINLLENN